MEAGKIFCYVTRLFGFSKKNNNLHTCTKSTFKHLKRDFTCIIKLQGISLIKHMVTAQRKPVSQIEYAN